MYSMKKLCFFFEQKKFNKINWYPETCFNRRLVVCILWITSFWFVLFTNRSLKMTLSTWHNYKFYYIKMRICTLCLRWEGVYVFFSPIVRDWRRRIWKFLKFVKSNNFSKKAFPWYVYQFYEQFFGRKKIGLNITYTILHLTVVDVQILTECDFFVQIQIILLLELVYS